MTEGEMAIIAKELETGPEAGRALKVLTAAKDHGWYENPYHSFVIRLTREDAQPIFARWDVAVTQSGKISYRFQGARAKNGQPMNYNDLLAVLEDPRLLLPEPPAEIQEKEGEANDCSE